MGTGPRGLGREQLKEMQQSERAWGPPERAWAGDRRLREGLKQSKPDPMHRAEMVPDPWGPGHLPWSSLSEIARPLSQLSSSPTNSRRVFILPPSPLLESQHASVCREQGTVMATARQPAGLRPSLPPALPEPC